MNSNPIAICGAMLLLASGAACAGPPYDVDDPGTAEASHFEINAGFASAQTRGSEEQVLPDVEVNYGYNDKLQLTVDVGIASIRESGVGRKSGFGDIGLEAKWRFLEETASRPQVAIDGSIKLPTASHARGLGSGKADYGTLLIVGKSYGRWTLFADAGYNFLGSRDEKNNANWGIAATNQISERSIVGAQIFGSGPDATDARSDVSYGVALQQTVAPDRVFLLQVGKSAKGNSDLNVYVGMQIVFGPKGEVEPVGEKKETDTSTGKAKT